MRKVIQHRIINPIKELAEDGKLAGILLIAATIVSIILSNLSFGPSYVHFWENEVGPSFFSKSIAHWVNDGLMAVFFLLVGLEIKRELLKGELSELKKALLPIFAALGGVIVPALIFTALNGGTIFGRGWAIPTATDIAFSLGVISILGKKVPFSLKVFLTALAIIDDLCAIVIIAFFYSSELAANYLFYAGLVFVLLMLFNVFRVKNLWFYFVPGVVLWWLVLNSGVHATIAGVLLAIALPIGSLEKIEHALHKPVNYFILPLFALVNTAITLSGESFSMLFSSLSLGIVLGLFFGKPIGIMLVTWITVKLKICKLPEYADWWKIAGVGFTAGIGFTMSIFITNLSFSDIDLVNLSKLSIIIASVMAAAVSYVILKLAGR